MLIAAEKLLDRFGVEHPHVSYGPDHGGDLPERGVARQENLQGGEDFRRRLAGDQEDIA